MAEFDPDAFLAKQDKRKERNTGFDPDAFLAKTAPETAAQTFGRSAASLADTALNAITGTLDYGAYALARAAGRTPEQATAETTSPKDVVGRAFGVTGTAGYENAPLRSAGRFIGEQLGENVIQPVASATGIPEADVANMLNSLAMGVAPVAGKVAAPVARTAAKVPGVVAQVPGAVRDVAGGAYGSFTGKTAAPGAVPEPWQQPSVRQPVSKTYYTPEQITAWRAGELPTEQLTPQPIENLGPQALAALQKTEGNVPYTGQGFRAFGEQLGETYRNPLNLLTDVGLDVLTSGGLPTMARMGYKGIKGAQGATAAKTLEGAGFTRLYPAELAALESGQPHPSALGPIAPTAQPTATAPTVTTQPVVPQPVPRLGYSPTPSVMYGSETGIVGKTPQEVVTADLAQRYAPQPVAAVAPETVVAPAVDVAAQEAAKQASKQKVLDMINAKRAQQAQPEVPATTITPVEPTALPETPTITTAPTPSAEVIAAVPEMAKKTLPEIRFDVKNTGKGAITTKNNIIQLDKAAYDELAAMHGATLDWSKLGELKKGAADAREQVNNFVMQAIKEARGPEKRGPQMRTLQKQAEAELGIGKDTELTPEQLKRIGSTGKPQPAPTISPALQAMLDKQKAAGNYRGPKDVSQMMTSETVYPSLEEFNKATMMDVLAGKEQLGAYRLGDKIIQRIPNPERANVPDVFKDRFSPVKEIAYDANTGERVPVGSDWTEIDPKPFKQQVEDKLKKRK